MYAEWTPDWPRVAKPVSSADVERARNTAARHALVKIEVDCHKTTGTFESATLPEGRKPFGAK